MDIFDGSSGLWSTAVLRQPSGGQWGRDPVFVATSLPIQGRAIIAGYYRDNTQQGDYHTVVNFFDGIIVHLFRF